MRLDGDEMRARRNKIMKVGYKLFSEYGIEQISMGEIARQADVGKRTLYRYFQNKMDLIVEILVYQWNMLLDSIKKHIEYQTTYLLLAGYEQIVRWLDAFHYIYENNAHFIFFSYEAKLYIMRDKIQFTDKQKDLFALGIREPFVAALDKGKADGTLLFQHESIQIFYVIWASIRGCILLFGENSPCKDIYQVMEETVLKALCPDYTKCKGEEGIYNDS